MPSEGALPPRHAHDFDDPCRTTYHGCQMEGRVIKDRRAPEGVRLVLGILTDRTEITPHLVSTSDEPADRPSAEGLIQGQKRRIHNRYVSAASNHPSIQKRLEYRFKLERQRAGTINRLFEPLISLLLGIRRPSRVRGQKALEQGLVPS